MLRARVCRSLPLRAVWEHPCPGLQGAWKPPVSEVKPLWFYRQALGPPAWVGSLFVRTSRLQTGVVFPSCLFGSDSTKCWRRGSLWVSVSVVFSAAAPNICTPGSASHAVHPCGSCVGRGYPAGRRRVLSVLGLQEAQQLSFHKLMWDGFLRLCCQWLGWDLCGDLGPMKANCFGSVQVLVTDFSNSVHAHIHLDRI